MRRATMPRHLEHVQVTDQVRLHISVRVLDRVADAGLGAEMCDLVERQFTKRLIEPLAISEIRFDEVETATEILLLLRHSVPLQIDAVISVEVIDPDDVLAALQQPAR